MRILLAPGTFKGSLSAEEAAQAMTDGVHNCGAGFEPILFPVGDGGEGTTAALLRAIPGSREQSLSAMGPMQSSVAASWALLGPNYRTAALDMASAAGLLLVPEPDRNPMQTTTYGVGQLIKAILGQDGVQRLIIGLGGSATNDGGAGCLQGMGFVLLDANGNELPAPILSSQLNQVHKIRDAQMPGSYRKTSITIACDVDNPLTGPRGASVVFGPQKGATPVMVDDLDRLLNHFGAVLDEFAHRNAANAPDWIALPNRLGAGAAGGLGAALMAAFPQAVIKPGIDVVLDEIGFDEALTDADLVLTGEGRLDAQTLGGKVIVGVMRRAARFGVPVAVVAGSADGDVVAELRSQGIEQVISLESLAGSVALAISDAQFWIARSVEAILKDRASEHPQ